MESTPVMARPGHENDPHSFLAYPDKIEDRWSLCQELGTGSFGKVYRGTDTWSGMPVAVKEARIEKYGTLKAEKFFYDILWQDMEDLEGIPRVFHRGKHSNCEVMVMQCLGSSLFDLRNLRGGSLSLKTVFMIGLQALDRLEFVHSRDIIHRDIKPENMVIGLEDKQNIYLVDFGLAALYRDDGGCHLPRVHEEFVGTPDYASLNAHVFNKQARRDDLESLGYTLVALHKGPLPWTKIFHFDPAIELADIGLAKKNTDLNDLCSGMGMEMVEYIREVRRFKYDETPNYDFLRSLFHFGLRRLGFENDCSFDWI